jgi:peptidyl-prolyl cis-trans isomerase SurA
VRVAVALLTALLAPSRAATQPYVVDKIVAVVGNHIVMMSDVEALFLRYSQEGSMPDSIRCDLLDQLLGQKLLLAQAELDSITVPEDQIEYELTRRIDYFIELMEGREQLEAYYGMSYEEMKDQFRPDIREQLVAQKMQGIITEDVTISPKEVRDYFNGIPADSLPLFPIRIQVGQVVMRPKVSEIQTQLASDLAGEVRTKIINGRSFCSMVALYSDDLATKDKCGELPEFGRNDGYAKEFVAAAFKLQDGEMSDIVKTQFGFHIIQMIKRSGERVKVRHILVRPKITPTDIERASGFLDSVRTLVSSQQLHFAQAVSKFSDDEATKQTNGIVMNPASGDQWFDMTALQNYDPELRSVVEYLEVGDISRPQTFKDPRGDDAVRIIYLKSEVPAHMASIETDYPLIEAEALALKKLEATDAWLRERISKTYIKIDESYGDCAVLQSWVR